MGDVRHCVFVCMYVSLLDGWQLRNFIANSYVALKVPIAHLFYSISFVIGSGVTMNRKTEFKNKMRNGFAAAPPCLCVGM